MKCPICNKETEIITTKELYGRIFREHYCKSCKEKFVSINSKYYKNASIPKKPIIDEPETPWEFYLARGYIYD